VVRCATEQQARKVLAALEERMAEAGRQLHPDKTRIVYCEDRNRRRSDYAETPFIFLGYTFPARQALARQGGSVMFSAFLPRGQRKYKRLRSYKKVRKWWKGLIARQPRLFAHWTWMTGLTRHWSRCAEHRNLARHIK
jgi:RNA-directed DNA polymerase